MSEVKKKLIAFVNEYDVRLNGEKGDYFIGLYHFLIPDFMEIIADGDTVIEGVDLHESYASILIESILEDFGISINEIWEGATP